MKSVKSVMPLLLTVIMVAAAGTGLVSCSSTLPASRPPGSNQPITAAGDAMGIRSLPASSWRALYNGRSMSLLEILGATGKQAAIFQLAGVICDTCQRDAVEYTRRIQASSMQQSIGHVIIFTDFPEDYQESDFSSFMNQFAPQSMRTHDDRAKLWLSLQKNAAMPDRNVIIVLGQSGRGLFLNEPTSRDKIFAALESLGSSGSSGSSPASPMRVQ